MLVEDSASLLLSGPRGRRLCAELVPWPGPDGSPSTFAYQAPFFRAHGQEAWHREVLDELARGVLEAWSGDRRSLLVALADTVGWARYWQAPEDVDVALGSAEARGLLTPVAESIVERAPWLWGELLADDQYLVLTRGDQTYPEDGRGAGPGLHRWRELAVADEARELPLRLRPATSDYSGTWWSTPAMVGCPQTTRSISGTGDVGLPLHVLLQEDSFGEAAVSARRMRAGAGARVLEVRGPSDWVDLVEAYPMVVTRSRAHDWYRATGRIGAWVQPDWAAVASSYDAVHLTVAGYLCTAGRAVDTDVQTSDGPAASVLAGWDPDATWWFSDALEPAGPIRRWQRGDDALDWAPDADPRPESR